MGAITNSFNSWTPCDGPGFDPNIEGDQCAYCWENEPKPAVYHSFWAGSYGDGFSEERHVYHKDCLNKARALSRPDSQKCLTCRREFKGDLRSRTDKVADLLKTPLDSRSAKLTRAVTGAIAGAGVGGGLVGGGTAEAIAVLGTVGVLGATL